MDHEVERATCHEEVDKEHADISIHDVDTHMKDHGTTEYADGGQVNKDDADQHMTKQQSDVAGNSPEKSQMKNRKKGAAIINSEINKQHHIVQKDPKAPKKQNQIIPAQGPPKNLHVAIVDNEDINNDMDEEFTTQNFLNRAKWQHHFVCKGKENESQKPETDLRQDNLTLETRPRSLHVGRRPMPLDFRLRHWTSANVAGRWSMLLGVGLGHWTSDVGLCRGTSAYAVGRRPMPWDVCLCRLTSAYIAAHQTSSYAVGRRPMSADVGLCRCTSAYAVRRTYFSNLPELFSTSDDQPYYPPYHYIMKADDDTYICFESLVQSLRPLPREDLYYGYVIPCPSMDPFVRYMSGMGNLVSWDIAEWIKDSDIQII
ncbi:hypothetical protein RND71_009665 [Anisodus tanguticus]|uniref:Hexosyltransferase n=1 Tax=Anisodus tanguticus TaxID=243964 RepID=A0AAE1SI77_9SOLA|nr:hypothetical protein RND71_009665 [Anisodus tanguticus]